MNKVKTTLKKLWADESGQGATEYILLLVVIVVVATLFGDHIKEVLSEKIADLSGRIQSFNPQKH